MSRVLTLLLSGAFVVVVQVAGADPPAPPPDLGSRIGLRNEAVPLSEAGLPVGMWKVDFANGVTELCVICPDGKASVIELRRTSGGKATAKGSSAVLSFEDDRVERWTPVGKRFVVEHWFPGSAFPTGTSVLGIAERVK